MNYKMVKQFSNNSIDNFFNFFYKIADFGKIWVDVFWAFVEIWEAFFLIFYNMFMYFYYLLLLGIDKSTTESQSTLFFWRRGPKRSPYLPSKVYVKDLPNPVPSAYGKQAVTKVAQTATAATGSAKQAVTETIISATEKLRKAPGGQKKPILRSMLEFFSEFFTNVGEFFKKPALQIADFFASRMRPVREEAAAQGSLIDEYMKEYEQKRGKSRRR